MINACRHLLFLVAMAGGMTPAGAASLSGDGSVELGGELKQWHKVTLTLDGPFARERDTASNPFTDYRMTVTFRHESGALVYRVPGYFAADGRAAHSSAEKGTAWRAHLAPDEPGRWMYDISFARGRNVAVSGASGEPMNPYDGKRGSFVIAPSDKSGRDFRAHGRLEYVGRRYLRFAGSGEYFLKAGPDSPENLLGYEEFDGTRANKQGRQVQRKGETMPAALHRYEPHISDWRPGDPTWGDARGKGLIGALNYLADKGLNAFSFLTYNAGGDGDDVWPFVERGDKLHYDCSKLDQWDIVFEHAQALGLFLHFKLQEQENDDSRKGPQRRPGEVPVALDGGALGVERKLYCRELIARFGWALALNWNLGEENTQSPEEQRAMAGYLRETDPYKHHIVVHTYIPQQDEVYSALLGGRSDLTGVSLQEHWSNIHSRVRHWVSTAEAAGKPWVVCNDEQGPAGFGVPPDPGYEGREWIAGAQDKRYTVHDIRRHVLWGTLLAGGAGVEYYFGYQLPHNDLTCEDFRARDRSWDYCRVALQFFRDHQVPFWEMASANALVGNPDDDNSGYCFARQGEIYLVYISDGGVAELDLSGEKGVFSVAWFDPRRGGALTPAGEVRGATRAALTAPSSDDWLAIVRRK